MENPETLSTLENKEQDEDIQNTTQNTKEMNKTDPTKNSIWGAGGILLTSCEQ